VIREPKKKGVKGCWTFALKGEIWMAGIGGQGTRENSEVGFRSGNYRWKLGMRVKQSYRRPMREM
jgi:hypothetical protein